MTWTTIKERIESALRDSKPHPHAFFMAGEAAEIAARVIEPPRCPTCDEVAYRGDLIEQTDAGELSRYEMTCDNDHHWWSPWP